MNRRDLVVAISAAVSAGLAGCSQGDDPDSGVESSPAASEQGGDFARHRDEAVGALNLAAASLEASLGGADPREADFDPAEARGRVETATDALNSAATAASTDDQEAQLAAVRQYADAVSGLIESVALFTQAAGGLESLRETIQTGEFTPETVRPRFGEVRDTGRRAVEAHEGAATAVGNADTQLLLEQNALIEEVSAGVDQIRPYADGLDRLLGGYDTLLVGLEQLDTASTQLTAEKIEEASAALSAATEALNDVRETLEASREDVPTELTGAFDTGLNLAGDLETLATGYTELLDGVAALGTAVDALSAEETDRAQTNFETAADDAATAGETFGADESRRDAFAAEFKTARDRATAVNSLTTGYRELVAATVTLEEGRDAFESGSYDRAAEQFDTAVETLTAGGPVREAFADGSAAVDRDEFTGVFERATCRAGHFENAAQEFATAAEAGQRRNLTAARQAAERGETALARASEC